MDTIIPEAISEISRQRIKTLYSGLQPLAFRVLEDALNIFKVPMNVVQGLRSMDEQWSLYKQGRKCIQGQWTILDAHKIVTNARPGLSFHNYGLAFDCAFAGEDPYIKKLPIQEQESKWIKYGEIVKSHGFFWGGDFRIKNGAKDLPHAELAYGLQIHECLELYSQGGIKAIWDHVDKIRGI